MAWKLFGQLGKFLGRDRAGPSTSEVAVANCALEGVDPARRPRVNNGEELRLVAMNGKVGAMRGKSLLGYVPGDDARHVARLVEQGAGLGCRVVQVDSGNSRVLVRIFIAI